MHEELSKGKFWLFILDSMKQHTLSNLKDAGWLLRCITIELSFVSATRRELNFQTTLLFWRFVVSRGLNYF